MLDYEFFFIISLPVYILLLVVGMWWRAGIQRVLLCSLFYFYLITLLGVTMFPIPVEGLGEIGKNDGVNNNFIPFMSILDIVSNDNLSYRVKIKQIIGNIILFIPFGFCVPFIWKSMNHVRKALLIAILCSFCIELSQYLISFLLGFNYKITDVDDILLNSLGFVIGFFLYKIFLSLAPQVQYKQLEQ